MTPEYLMECRIYYEHGYITLRNPEGHLLHEVSASDIDNGIGLSVGIIWECVRQDGMGEKGGE